MKWISFHSISQSSRSKIAESQEIMFETIAMRICDNNSNEQKNRNAINAHGI